MLLLAEAHCMQRQKYKLIAKTNVIYYILIRLTQLYYITNFARTN